MRTTARRTAATVVISALLLGASARQAAAQLNEHCSVSVLNRTVKANPDGTWVLPNIPAESGRVKARATCVESGRTRFGESEYFTIPRDGIVTLPAIVLGDVSAIPASIVLAPNSIVFTTVGETIPLVVTATYPDGSTRNVSAATAGTDYTISNSSIATVSPDGLVTAVSSGIVVIQATNEGTPGMATARVVLSTADTDGDGIPDDSEVAFGLDPRNPVDAQEDLDRDDLTNLDEYRAGTDNRRADTDGDGLRDGAEVRNYLSSPLLADTDGDLIPDGIEATTGTSPIDRDSYDLYRASASVTVAPSSFLLATNPLLGDVSQQLTLVVRLIDGTTTLDLTADPRTNYASNNLLICNFGAERGRVFAGQPGECTITITNSTLVVDVPGRVRAFTPTALSRLNIPGSANSVDVSGDYAYVAAGSAGLQIVDVTARVTPFITAAQPLPGNANDVVVVGQLAYVAAGTAGLQIVNVSDPRAPVLAGSLSTGNVAWDVVVKAGRAYVANGAGGLVIIDVSTPSAPQLLGSISLPGISQGVDVDNGRSIAVVARGLGGLSVIDVANASSPSLMGSLPGGDVRDVALDGNYALLADFSRSTSSVDLTDPGAPVLRASTPRDTGGLLQDVAVAGTIAAGADVFFVNGVPMFDVSDPANPLPKAIINFALMGEHQGTGIALDAAYVYMTGESGIPGDTVLYIGQYRSDDVTAPTVTIESPQPGSLVIEGSSLAVSVAASDDFAVASVEVLLDDQVVATATVAPYALSVNVPVGASLLTLSARAFDFAGNAGVSSDVLIPVTRDTDLPMVRITAPTAPLTVPEGSVIAQTVDASDNVAVTRVEFLINDLVVATKTAPPYQAFITLPIGPASFRLGARAFDPAGNAGLAPEVVVGVTTDPPPTISIVAPAAGTSVREGQVVDVVLQAADNAAVISTEFWVEAGGDVVLRDQRNLREFTFAIPIGFESITLRASATDNLGQIGIAEPIVLFVMDDAAPTIRFVSPVEGSTLVGGSTILVVVEASDDLQISSVSLERFGTLHSEPYEFLITVPELIPVLDLRATALDNIGNVASVDASLLVVEDPLTTVQGVVIDAGGNPAEGAEVVVTTNGLTAEFFRSNTPLTTIPNLSSTTADVVKVVSTPNVYGPTPDPFGLTRLAVPWVFSDPNTTVRLRGMLRVAEAGTYAFSLGTFAAGRLSIDGGTIIDLPTIDVTGPQSATANVVLPAGDVPIEVIGVADHGTWQVALQYMPPGGAMQGIPLDRLTPANSPYRATAGVGGFFAIPAVPSVLGDVVASATFVTGGSTLTGRSASTAPVPGGTTDVGSIQVAVQRRDTALPVSVIGIAGVATAVDVSGDFAYLAAGSSGLQMVYIRDAAHPSYGGQLALPGHANDVRIVGGTYAYVAAGTAGLQIVCVCPPANPTIVGSIDLAGEARAVDAVSGLAYVASASGELAVIDTTNVNTPVLLGTLALGGVATGVAVDGVRPLVVVARGPDGIAIVDVADPGHPQLIGALAGLDVRDVALASNTVLAATSSGLVSIDVTDPTAPQVIGELPGALNAVALSGTFAFGASFSPTDGVAASVIDVLLPSQPELANTIDFGGLPVEEEAPTAVTGIAANETFVFETATMNAAGFDFSYLYIGQYVVPTDTLGFPPQSLFTNVFPQFGPLPQVGESLVAVDVEANDDVALASVKIFVNGQLAATRSTPSSPVWRDRIEVAIPFDATSVTLTLETTDVGGNVGTQTVTTDVLPYLPSAGGSWSFGTPPSSIASDDTSVWLTLPDNTDGRGACRIRSEDEQFLFCTTTTWVPGLRRPGFVTVDPNGNAWVSNTDNNTVVQIAPFGGVIQTVAVANPGNLIAAGNDIWVVSGSSQIVRINTADGSVAGPFGTHGTNPGPLAFDGTYVWVANRLDNTAAILRPTTGGLVGIVPTGNNPSAMLFDGAHVWITNHDDDTVTKVRASDGVTLGTYPTGDRPSGIAFARSFIWVTNAGSDTASKIRASDGMTLGAMFAGPAPTAITYSGGRLWILSSADGKMRVARY